MARAILQPKGSGGSSSVGVVDVARSKLDTLASKGLVPVAHTQGQVGFTQTRSGPDTDADSAATSMTSETTHVFAVTCRDVYVLYTGFRPVGGGIGALPNAFTLRLGARATSVSSSTRTLLVPGGPQSPRTRTIEPGDVAMFGPIATEFGAGETLTLRPFVKVATLGQTWPVNNYGTIAVGSDYADTGTMPAYAGKYALYPIAILGRPVGAAKSVGVLGDSIGQGGGQQAGFWRDGFGSAVPVINMSIQAELGTNLLDRRDERAFRTAMAAHAGNVIWQYDHNDVHQQPLDLSPAAIDRMLLAARIMKARGCTVFMTTLTPMTTSTDGWTTVANQAWEASNGNGFHLSALGKNNWLRDGSPVYKDSGAKAGIGASGSNILRCGDSDDHPFAFEDAPPAPGCTYPGYFDLSDGIESARNSGLFKANYTGDGSHPSPTASADLAAKLSATCLRS